MSALAERNALSAKALLRRQFTLAHGRLDATIAGITPERLHRRPPCGAMPPGACFAQIVLCEDVSVNGVLAAKPPLALSSWAGRTGLSELPPLVGQAAWHAWARRVRLDLAALQPYARAVYVATDAYLAALPDDAFDSAQEERPASLLSALLLTLSMRGGEIACLLALDPCPGSHEAHGS
jgi:hypothetical protein